jgi:hypothetical protein
MGSAVRFDSRLLQREVGLAAAALLAAVLALGVAEWHRSEPKDPSLPASVPAPGGGWYEAIAAPIRSPGEPTECGYTVDAQTIGVAHPVLPCEVKLYVRHGANEVLTQVIGRPPPGGPGRQFGLTRRLARALGTDGTVRVRWRYAAAPSSR